MTNQLYLIDGIFEAAIVIFIIIFTISRNLISFKTNWILLVPGATLATGFIVNLFIGGIEAVPMILKVLSFVVLTAYALHHPMTASRWVLISTMLHLVVQAASGHVLDKLAAIPFILLATLWVVSKKRYSGRVIFILAIAFCAEILQAVLLESRGLLLAIIAMGGILLLSVRVGRIFIISCAILLPIVYPMLLLVVGTLLLSDSDLITATASNVERSMMITWSVQNFPSYWLIGPGGGIYADQVNGLMVFFQKAAADEYDPHHFLLSIWTSLGSFVVSTLFVIWSVFWYRGYGPRSRPSDDRIRFFLFFAVIAIFTFVLSPPSSYSRVHVALLTGISVAGFRNPSVLISKSIHSIRRTAFLSSPLTKLTQSGD